MATIGNGNDENSLKIKPSGNQGSDEVHIIIRDGKVICFEQKASNRFSNFSISIFMYLIKYHHCFSIVVVVTIKFHFF